MKYDLSKLFRKAWSLYRQALKKGNANFGNALRAAWTWIRVQASNAALVEAAAQAAGYGDMVYHTWAGWRTLGREVVHAEKCVFQVVIEDPTTVKGVRTASYFIREQTFEPLAI